MLAAIPATANAINFDLDGNGCPDPDRMILLDDGGAGGPVHLAGLDPIEVPTSQRTPALDGLDCDDDPTWCKDSFGYLPPEDVVQRDSLFLWFVGLGNSTDQINFIPQTGAYAGYRTINLTWDNLEIIENRCGPGGGSCDDTCVFDVATEYITGVDDPSTTLFQADPMHSVEGKLRLALEHLHERDVNLHGTAEEGWDDFCTETEVNWHLVEVGGFSAGAQLASYITYLEPGSQTSGSSIGFFGVDLGVPGCELTTNTDVTDAHYPAVMDQHAVLPPCGDNVTTPIAARTCPTDNRAIVMHEDGFFYTIGPAGNTLLSIADLGFPQEGVSITPFDIDTDIVAGSLLDASGDFNRTAFGNLLQTDVTPVPPFGAHGAMAEDVLMGDSRTSGAQASSAANYYLLPLYLQSICELDR